MRPLELALATVIVALGVQLSNFVDRTLPEVQNLVSFASLAEISLVPEHAFAFFNPPKPWETSVLVKGKNGFGSGVYLGGGQILTARHVAHEVAKAPGEFSVVSYGGKVYPVTTSDVWTCRDCDLAVIGVDRQIDAELHPASIACRAPSVGEPITYSGFPNFDGVSKDKVQRFTGRGYVANPTLLGSDDDGFKFTADLTLDVGASGSGVFDNHNNVIGVVVEVAGVQFGGPGGVFLPQRVSGITSILAYCDHDKAARMQGIKEGAPRE